MDYWVIGGKYKDTNFQDIEEGFEIERYGPYKNSEKAKEIWDYYSWKNVDDCFVRYTVIKK